MVLFSGHIVGLELGLPLIFRVKKIKGEDSNYFLLETIIKRSLMIFFFTKSKSNSWDYSVFFTNFKLEIEFEEITSTQFIELTCIFRICDSYVFFIGLTKYMIFICIIPILNT